MAALEELLQDVAECDVEFKNGLIVHAVYRPYESTNLDELVDATDAENDGDTEAQAEFTADLAVRMLVSWDLTRAGQVIPIETPALRTVPLNVLQHILRACREDAEPPNLNRSSGRSKTATTAKQSRRNGRSR